MEKENESERFLPSFLLNDIEYDEIDENLKEDCNQIIKG